ncbi:ClbS/DfsB family four-helix bundle protein [Acinetobacter rudis]|uniref:ClbS/DfsB family four-helix bundle protein n=1 Tax=Acinetobacter rudis TaxID=632955 RepID=A0AAW8J329_9GAMM|nr:ClbS/DfsB family four-helix bundle protein [Acinetobacter rudis]MDQ8934381.1 ClbS/DfsB family four-helix bundle protein [Acinetobacter rudis]MDQ9016719.1 ClbS/DfsB family four-helix bundle protein [Acinetobacter rudis]
MKNYESKQELIDAIRNSLSKYLLEFSDILEDEKNKIITGVDKTPSQNISYQLGWVSLLLEWEKDEKIGKEVITPKKGFKWNNLGLLYQEFYQTYCSYSLDEKKRLLSEKVNDVIDWIQSLTDDELFLPNQRKWATTAAKWPVYKWIHINTVAPFTNFRVQIRKWKKLKG